MSKKNGRGLALLGFLILALACGLAGSAKKRISVSLDKKEIREMDSSGLTLVFYLRISNSSSVTFYLMQYDYRVVVQDTDYFSLRTPLEQPIPVEKNGDTLISLPVRVNYALLFEAIKGIKENKTVTSYITGLLVFSDERNRQEKTPFAFSGEFPVFADLTVSVHPLVLKNLTVGGVDFVFTFSCQNPNSFDVTLGALNYQLSLGGKKVLEGVLPEENRIEAQGEKAFAIPAILDFFEVGKELFLVFDQDSAVCQFTGEAPASSIWGAFKLSFSQDETIKIFREE